MKPYVRLLLGVKNCLLVLAAVCAVALAFKLTHVVQAAISESEVTKMTDQISGIATKTVCVGRFLLDVPADAAVSYRAAFLSGWDINSDEEETDEAFAVRLRQQEAELRAAKNEHDQPSLEVAKAIETNGVHGKIFVFGREWTYSMNNGKRVDSTFATMHGYVRTGGVSFTFRAQIAADEDMEELTQLVSQLRARKQEEIPRQGGFCFDHGLIRDPLIAEQNERVAIFVGLASHPDVAIGFSTMAGLKPEPSLLVRDAGNSVKREHPENFRTIRSGPREINGVQGEEVPDLVHELNGSKLQDFVWEARGKKEDVHLPQIVFELNSGHGQPGSPVSSSISDAAALALWEKISSSVRRRPTKTDQ